MSAGEIQNKADEDLLKEMGAVEKALLNRLLRDLNLLTINGTLTFDPTYFAMLEDKIVNYMRELKYQEKVNAYLQNFDAIDEEAKKFYSRQRILLENEAIKNPVNEQLRKQVVESLRGSGVAEGFLKPVADVMRVQALQGLTIAEATAALTAKLTSDASLTRYVGQVTRDAISQYDGALNKEVAKKYGLKKFVYIDSVIETSRPICTHIKDKYRNVPIDEATLQKILDEFCPGGTPSEEKTTFTTVNDVTRTMAKGSGMIPGTNVSNFVQNRGGYNCRHEVKYVRDGVSTRESVLALLENL